MDEKEIKFIAERYRSGRFSADKGWKRLGIRPVSIWRKYRVAAAVAAAVVITASAVVIYEVNTVPTATQPEQVDTPTVVKDNAIKVIDFENASLATVVERIKEVYGVDVVGLPESPEDYALSLHYEGTATDLVETINEILGTNLKVEQR